VCSFAYATVAWSHTRLSKKVRRLAQRLGGYFPVGRNTSGTGGPVTRCPTSEVGGTGRDGPYNEVSRARILSCTYALDCEVSVRTFPMQGSRPEVNRIRTRMGFHD